MYFCPSRPVPGSTGRVGSQSRKFFWNLICRAWMVPGWRQSLQSESSRCRIHHGFSRSGCDSGKFNLCIRDWDFSSFVIETLTLSHYPQILPYISTSSLGTNESVGEIWRIIISHSLLLPGTSDNWVRCWEFRHAPKTRKQSGLILDIFGIRAANFPKTPAAQNCDSQIALAAAFKLPTYFLLLSQSCCQLPQFRDSQILNIASFKPLFEIIHLS